MISPLAQVHSSSEIADNVTIDAFAVIDEGVKIGEGTHVMSHAVILKGTTIGKSCRIFPGAVIGAIPQDLKFVGEVTTVEIGDHTTIRECVTVNRGTKDKWKTVVGSHCLLMAYVHVAHDCLLGDNVILANSVQLAGHVELDDYAIIGGTTGVTQFVRIGAHTYTAAHAIVTKDVPPFIKTGRVPFCFAGVNAVGLQRRGFSTEQINEIHEIYRHIYTKGLNISQAVDIIEGKFSSAEKKAIVEFIRGSKRGIVKGSKETENED
jgi:UDP-N-acetylglucosamine acyltransferase